MFQRQLQQAVEILEDVLREADVVPLARPVQ
jgi:hypothetical protein